MEKKSRREIIYQVEINNKKYETIIFLHALALNKSAFKNIISFFLKNNFNIINIELRGHGYSNKQNCFKNIYIEESIIDVIDILKKENINNKAILLGHSLGAVISSCLISRYPERFKKIIICAPLFRSPLKDQIFNMSFLKIFILIMTYITCYISRIIYKRKYIYLNNLPQKTLLLFSKGLSRCYPNGIYNITDIIYSNSFDISKELKKIKKNALIIGGKNDFLVNKKILNKIKNLISNSILKIYPGNHMIIYQTKKIWYDINNFIKN